ncbi:hypothetical protein E1258_19330 [Micromonospora sp. KC207]|uniref:hypothetical protein n=1 Tax=Micromonospora sp. KC207 TaxID=2530377 RepID=UPI00104408DE|nr:hypothetical protein [Micromonospora sp. KC207]TDC59063.1 hypothetical protein E1258_19330 [Micromonospora sp. KC207]
MQRILVAVALAPLLGCALLLHIGLVCLAPMNTAALDTVAATGPIATTRPALPKVTGPTVAIGPIVAVESSGTARPRVTGPAVTTGSTVALEASVTDGFDPAVRHRAASRTGRAGRVTLEAYRLVTTLAARTDQSPDPTVVPRFDGKACGSATRSGRGNQSTDRRDPGPQASSALPDATVRRDNTADGRPVTADAGPDPIRLSVLRC